MIKNITIALGFLMALVALILQLRAKEGDTVFIDNGKVYEGFKMTSELNKELEAVINARKNITDSLLRALRMEAMALEQNPNRKPEEVERFKRGEQELNARIQEYEKQNQETAESYNEKIWKQVNQYVADYGRENKCLIVLGANGQGNIMYGDPQGDVTEKVIKYINNKYDGGTN